MNVSVTSGGSLKTSIYEKPMALYLFIPPQSSHPPGVLRSHINGNILRIMRLSSDENDAIKDIKKFFNRFLARGHSYYTLQPLFLRAIASARKFMAKSHTQRLAEKKQKLEEASSRLYFHVEYHPQNPSAHQIQQSFHDNFLHPPGEKHVNEIENGNRCKIPISSLIIANHRAKNLGDLFTYRDISKKHGPPVSTYMN